MVTDRLLNTLSYQLELSGSLRGLTRATVLVSSWGEWEERVFEFTHDPEDTQQRYGREGKSRPRNEPQLTNAENTYSRLWSCAPGEW